MSYAFSCFQRQEHRQTQEVHKLRERTQAVGEGPPPPLSGALGSAGKQEWRRGLKSGVDSTALVSALCGASRLDVQRIQVRIGLKKQRVKKEGRGGQ